MIGVIGGTGIYDPTILENTSEERITTPYGEVLVTLGQHQSKRVAFIPRHGGDHSVPPHLINYRANIEALRSLGVHRIVATAAVGSLNFEYKPGTIVIIDQFLDFTKNRISTFFDGQEHGLIHVDVTKPFCGEVRQALFRAAAETGTSVFDSGVYVCTEGPRFETAAEIRMFKSMGGDVVGMTAVPEVVLAREAGICYGTVAVVTNYAAGISTTKLTHEEVVDCMHSNITRIRQTIMGAISFMPPARECECSQVPEAVKVK